MLVFFNYLVYTLEIGAIVQNIFQKLPGNFFRPLTGKNKEIYAEVIQLIYNNLSHELTYGVNRDIVVGMLENYFDDNAPEMFFEDEEIVVVTPREKANAVINVLKKAGWLEYEPIENHQTMVVLFEYALPIIQSFQKIIKDDETEYQGLVSQIFAVLQNNELYKKPYEQVLKPAKENTDRLISDLKKISSSIKRHADKQTANMNAYETLGHFFLYHQEIGSKAYLRMKTSENISYFRNAIIEKTEEFSTNPTIMDLAVKGYAEVENQEDKNLCHDEIIQILYEIKSAFHRIDDIIYEIDRKHTIYMRNAVARAKFLLASGNNMEEKILQILQSISNEVNKQESNILFESAKDDLMAIFKIFPQRIIDSESLYVMPVAKQKAHVDEFSGSQLLTEEERRLYKEALQEKNRQRFTRKNIDEWVANLFTDVSQVRASSLPLLTKKDFIRLIYIRLYASKTSNCYYIEKSEQKVTKNGFDFMDFDIKKR